MAKDETEMVQAYGIKNQKLTFAQVFYFDNKKMIKK